MSGPFGASGIIDFDPPERFSKAVLGSRTKLTRGRLRRPLGVMNANQAHRSRMRTIMSRHGVSADGNSCSRRGEGRRRSLRERLDAVRRTVTARWVAAPVAAVGLIGGSSPAAACPLTDWLFGRTPAYAAGYGTYPATFPAGGYSAGRLPLYPAANAMVPGVGLTTPTVIGPTTFGAARPTLPLLGTGSLSPVGTNLGIPPGGMPLPTAATNAYRPFLGSAPTLLDNAAAYRASLGLGSGGLPAVTPLSGATTGFPLTATAARPGFGAPALTLRGDNPSVYTGLPVTTLRPSTTTLRPSVTPLRGVPAATAIGPSNLYPANNPYAANPYAASTLGGFSAARPLVGNPAAVPTTSFPTTGFPATGSASIAPVGPAVPEAGLFGGGLRRFFGSLFGTNYRTGVYAAPVTYYRPAVTASPIYGQTQITQLPCTGTESFVQRIPSDTLLGGSADPMMAPLPTSTVDGMSTDPCESIADASGVTLPYASIEPYSDVQPATAIDDFDRSGVVTSEYLGPITRTPSRVLPQTPGTTRSGSGLGTLGSPEVGSVRSSGGDVNDLSPVEQPRLRPPLNQPETDTFEERTESRDPPTSSSYYDRWGTDADDSTDQSDPLSDLGRQNNVVNRSDAWKPFQPTTRVEDRRRAADSTAMVPPRRQTRRGVQAGEIPDTQTGFRTRHAEPIPGIEWERAHHDNPDRSANTQASQTEATERAAFGEPMPVGRRASTADAWRQTRQDIRSGRIQANEVGHVQYLEPAATEPVAVQIERASVPVQRETKTVRRPSRLKQNVVRDTRGVSRN